VLALLFTDTFPIHSFLAYENPSVSLILWSIFALVTMFWCRTFAEWTKWNRKSFFLSRERAFQLWKPAVFDPTSIFLLMAILLKLGKGGSIFLGVKSNESVLPGTRTICEPILYLEQIARIDLLLTCYLYRNSDLLWLAACDRFNTLFFFC